MLNKRNTVELFALARDTNPWGTPPLLRTFAFVGPGDADLWAMQLATHALRLMQMLPMSVEQNFYPAGAAAAAPVGVYARRGWAGATKRWNAGHEYDIVVMRVFANEDGTLFPDTFYSTVMKNRSAACEELYPQSERITNLGAAIPDDHPCVFTSHQRDRNYGWGEVRKDKTGDVVRLMRDAMGNAMISYALEQLCGPVS